MRKKLRSSGWVTAPPKKRTSPYACTQSKAFQLLGRFRDLFDKRRTTTMIVRFLKMVWERNFGVEVGMIRVEEVAWWSVGNRGRSQQLRGPP